MAAPAAALEHRVHVATRLTTIRHCGCRKAPRSNSTRRAGAISKRGWQRRFDDPIPLPRGRQLVTLEDAGNYITKLPKAEHEAAEAQAAMETLMLVATADGPTMLARIGAIRA